MTCTLPIRLPGKRDPVQFADRSRKPLAKRVVSLDMIDKERAWLRGHEISHAVHDRLKQFRGHFSVTAAKFGNLQEGRQTPHGRSAQQQQRQTRGSAVHSKQKNQPEDEDFRIRQQPGADASVDDTGD